MKRIRLKKKRKLKTSDFLVIIITSIIITIFIVFKVINSYITPVIMNYANIQAKKIATLVISKAVNEKLSQDFKNTDIFLNSGENTIDFNPIALSSILSSVSSNVRTYLKDLEDGKIKNLNLSDNSYFNVDEKKLKNGVIYQVPTGIIFSNGLLANIGPKIPVKLNMIGDIIADITTDIKDYGINNAVIEVSVKVKVSEQVILPFSYEQITVETNIPIAIKLIEGDIPNYYINGSETKSLVVPVEDE